MGLGGFSSQDLTSILADITALQLTDSKFQKIIKQSDETIQSDIVLSNDAELFFNVLANKKYVGLATIYLISDATADIKTTFSIPSGATGDKGAGALNSITPFNSVSIASPQSGSTNGVNQMLVIPFHILTSVTSGIVYFQWCQLTSIAINTKVFAGSNIVVWET